MHAIGTKDWPVRASHGCPSQNMLGRPLGPLRTKRAKDEPKPRLLVANTTEKDV